MTQINPEQRKKAALIAVSLTANLINLIKSQVEIDSIDLKPDTGSESGNFGLFILFRDFKSSHDKGKEFEDLCNGIVKQCISSENELHSICSGAEVSWEIIPNSSIKSKKRGIPLGHIDIDIMTTRPDLT